MEKLKPLFKKKILKMYIYDMNYDIYLGFYIYIRKKGLWGNPLRGRRKHGKVFVFLTNVCVCIDT